MSEKTIEEICICLDEVSPGTPVASIISAAVRSSSVNRPYYSLWNGYELAVAENRMRMRTLPKENQCACFYINTATIAITSSGSGGSNKSKPRSQ